MMESSRPEEVQAELLRADKSLAAARSLLNDDFLEMPSRAPTTRFFMQLGPYADYSEAT